MINRFVQCTSLYSCYLRSSHLFYPDSITFDWGIFDIYIASITHQKLVLLMLIASCKELPEKEVDPKFHPETWLKTLAYYESEWKTYAESTGPEAAKYLYWGPHRQATCPLMV